MTARALKAARKLEDPWRRCQALAHVALESGDCARTNAILDQAFASALEIEDVNRRVSVSAWPLKVLCRSGSEGKLSAETRRLVELAASEPSPVRRADALNMVLGAIVTGPRRLFLEVLERLKVACLAPLASGRKNGKGTAHFATWTGIVACLDQSLATEMLQWVAGPSLRDRAAQDITRNAGRNVEAVCSWPNIGRVTGDA